VNQAEDPISLSHRKVSNVNQRRAIRSHVMQRIRQEELARGKKRHTGRELPKRPTPHRLRSISSDTDSSGKTRFTSSTSFGIKHAPTDFEPDSLTIKYEKANVSPTNAAFEHVPHNVSPGVHEFHPFQTLPSNSLPCTSLESLMQYCAQP